MKTNRYDKLIWELTRPMWFLLSLMAVYIIYKFVQMLHASSAVDIDMNIICRLIEHLLAGCAVTAAIGTSLEYIASNNDNKHENE